jgi:hypothetical protein
MSFQSLDCIFNQRKLVPSQIHILILLLCVSFTNMSNTERSFLMIKPDGVQRGLVGDIIKRFEAKGFKLVAMKFMWVSANNLKMALQKYLRNRCKSSRELI